MNILNKCCFKNEQYSYLICYYNWRKFTNEFIELKDTLQCTNTDGSKINIKIHNYDNIVVIEMERGHSNEINIKSCKYDIKNIILHFPFEQSFSNYNNDINIISTMCRMYNFRLDEWIDYHLKLGVDVIVIFDNTKNKTTNNEGDQDNDPDMTKVTEKYGDKVVVVDFSYAPLIGYHWNNLQSVSLFIGLHALKYKSKYITFIDADEFLKVENNDIKKFCENNSKTYQLCGNFMTNKSDNDVIDNNILQICKYVGKPTPEKMMVYSKDFLSNNPFYKFFNPHAIYNKNARTNKITLYHCWVNKRMKYEENMKYLDLLENNEK